MTLVDSRILDLESRSFSILKFSIDGTLRIQKVTPLIFKYLEIF